MCLTALALFFLSLFRSSLALRFVAPSNRAVSDCTELPCIKACLLCVSPFSTNNLYQKHPTLSRTPSQLLHDFRNSLFNMKQRIDQDMGNIGGSFHSRVRQTISVYQISPAVSPPAMVQPLSQQHSLKPPWKAKDLQGIRAAQLPQKQFLAELMAPPEVHWYYPHWCSGFPINTCWLTQSHPEGPA